ncbi:hypothetical protein HELRODRAFT_168289 [Helobdella robusta]|uniref:BTB domain-containing protein n=1 Tax=Helobdella robusta TaxID=6412 RepID=T1F0E5_HELRO|nr:hypothetical protein HELRODRAFT_168289 [Helobdella robusta]ESO09322.1 hypothetical protein HELRODRAFT_168289 [Helobdella robusta]
MKKPPEQLKNRIRQISLETFKKTTDPRYIPPTRPPTPPPLPPNLSPPIQERTNNNNSSNFKSRRVNFQESINRENFIRNCNKIINSIRRKININIFNNYCNKNIQNINFNKNNSNNNDYNKDYNNKNNSSNKKLNSTNLHNKFDKKCKDGEMWKNMIVSGLDPSFMFYKGQSSKYTHPLHGDGADDDNDDDDEDDDTHANKNHSERKPDNKNFNAKNDQFIHSFRDTYQHFKNIQQRKWRRHFKNDAYVNYKSAGNDGDDDVDGDDYDDDGGSGGKNINYNSNDEISSYNQIHSLNTSSGAKNELFHKKISSSTPTLVNKKHDAILSARRYQSTYSQYPSRESSTQNSSTFTSNYATSIASTLPEDQTAFDNPNHVPPEPAHRKKSALKAPTYFNSTSSTFDVVSSKQKRSASNAQQSSYQDINAMDYNVIYDARQATQMPNNKGRFDQTRSASSNNFEENFTQYPSYQNSENANDVNEMQYRSIPSSQLKIASGALLMGRYSNRKQFPLDDVTYNQGSRRVIQFMHSLWLEQTTCDVTIVANGGQIMAHQKLRRNYTTQVIMAAWSPTLASVFKQHSLQFEHTDDPVTFNMTDYPCDVVADVINFMYTTDIHLELANVGMVVAVSRELDLSTLVNVCGDFLIKTCTPDQVLLNYSVAANNNLRYAEEGFADVIANSMIEVSEQKYFCYLPFERLYSFLTHPKMCGREIDIFFAIVKWVDFNRSSRLKYSKDLLPLVRFQHMCMNDLSQKVEFSGWIFTNKETKDLLLNAYKYHAMLSSGVTPPGDFKLDKPRCAPHNKRKPLSASLGEFVNDYSTKLEKCIVNQDCNNLPNNWDKLEIMKLKSNLDFTSKFGNDGERDENETVINSGWLANESVIQNVFAQTAPQGTAGDLSHHNNAYDNLPHDQTNNSIYKHDATIEKKKLDAEVRPGSNNNNLQNSDNQYLPVLAARSFHYSNKIMSPNIPKEIFDNNNEQPFLKSSAPAETRLNERLECNEKNFTEKSKSCSHTVIQLSKPNPSFDQRSSLEKNLTELKNNFHLTDNTFKSFERARFAKLRMKNPIEQNLFMPQVTYSPTDLLANVHGNNADCSHYR